MTKTQQTINWVKARYKAFVAGALGILGPLVALLQTNQNITLKDVGVALLAGIVSFAAVHETTNVN